jgi:phage FluMu gp28-like protein
MPPESSILKPDASSLKKFFLPYQAAWIKDPSRLKIMQKSRQIGLSWSTAYSLVRDTAANDARNDVWVSSRDDIQARLFLEDCKSFAGILQMAASDLGEQVIDPDRKISAYVLQFANGKRINSMSSNPDAQAGKRGTRVLDEFALHPDPRKLYAIAYPGITWGGSMQIISTHRGSQNLFNDLVQEIIHKGNPKGFSLHTVTLQDALEQGFLEKLKTKLPPDDERQSMDAGEYYDFIRAGCPDEETFQQEYMCRPSDDTSAFLSYDLIRGCEYSPAEVWESPLDNPQSSIVNPLYLGVDVGRDHDLTVFWLVEKFGGVSFTRRKIELRAETFDEQERQLYALLALPQLRRCCIDATGIGRQFAERAQQRFGTYKVEQVQFTGPVKEELAYPLRAAFEDKSVRIPNDEFVRADLRAVKKETTSSGNIRFTADRGKNGHADRFWALALALHAAKDGGVWIPPPRSIAAHRRTENNRRIRELAG